MAGPLTRRTWNAVQIKGIHDLTRSSRYESSFAVKHCGVHYFIALCNLNLGLKRDQAVSPHGCWAQAERDLKAYNGTLKSTF